MKIFKHKEKHSPQYPIHLWLSINDEYFLDYLILVFFSNCNFSVKEVPYGFYAAKTRNVIDRIKYYFRRKNKDIFSNFCLDKTLKGTIVDRAWMFFFKLGTYCLLKFYDKWSLLKSLIARTEKLCFRSQYMWHWQKFFKIIICFLVMIVFH